MMEGPQSGATASPQVPPTAARLLEPVGAHGFDACRGSSQSPQTAQSSARVDLSLKRFTAASVVGVGVVLVPYLWVLFALWEPPSLFRTTNGGYGENFYDLQARAMLHGHLYLPNGSIGLEAFLHNGHTYTYFDVFPSLLRIPVLLVTHSLDGRLSALSILIAWLLTGLFTSLLVWRVRFLIRGPAILGRAETASLGVLMATVMGGSVLVFLAANPYAYSEDLAWSVALTTGSFFALLGVLERPSSGRVVASGVLVLASYLSHATTGLGCVIGALLVAAWFALGRDGAPNRGWWLPMFAVGFVPLVIGCAINLAKFGLLFGLPTSGQIGAAAFGLAKYKYFSVSYLPTTLHAYLQPGGLKLDDVFPYITMPPEVHSTSVVTTDPTASLPVSMPLLFILGVWGTVCALRPRPSGKLSVMRLLLVAAALGGSVLMIWGAILERYLAEFLPFLILAGAVGFVDVWRRVERKRRRTRALVLGAMSILGLFSIAANFGISLSPTETWSSVQARNYVEFQKSISDVTGHPLAAYITRGEQRPFTWAPRGQLFVVGDCSALYLANGLGQSGIPNLGFGWSLVEKAPGSNLCRTLIGSARYIPFHAYIALPRNHATVSGSQVLLLASTPSPPSKVSSVSFVLGAGSRPPSFLGDGRNTRYGWFLAWNSESIPNGAYVLRSVARDSDGQVVTSPGVKITIHNPVAGT
jgi:hypothetical protein